MWESEAKREREFPGLPQPICAWLVLSSDFLTVVRRTGPNCEFSGALLSRSAGWHIWAQASGADRDGGSESGLHGC